LCETVCRLIYVTLLIMSLHFKLTCLILQPLFFLKVEKLICVTVLFLLSLSQPRLSKDWYIWYWPSFVLSHIHFAIIHPHFIHSNFLFIWLLKCLWSMFIINLLNICWHYKSPPFHRVIRIHLILLTRYHLIFLLLPSHFIFVEQMLMFMLIL